MRILRTADVFCRVVDNLGDAGVCWRLARQLAVDYGLVVRLWIDRPETLARIVGPDVVKASAGAGIALAAGADLGAGLDSGVGIDTGVTVHPWPEPWRAGVHMPADLVIAAFACRLPDAYLDAMAAATPQPVWFNLEYLSAEAWVADLHALPSPRPDRPLVEHFFFPGFDERTGGLLRERDLLARRDAFAADVGAQRALHAALGIGPRTDDELLVSMFCYPHAPLAALLAAWRDGDRPVRMVLPEGVGADAVAALFGAPPAAGMHWRAGALSVDVIALVAQPVYDQLLWSCDINFVRGEDSFVRAQWAARPMWWQAYPQAGGAERAKLDAFIDLYVADVDADTAGVVRAAMHAWNGSGDVAQGWRAMSAAHARIERLAARWSAAFAAQPDLATRLLAKAQNML